MHNICLSMKLPGLLIILLCTNVVISQSTLVVDDFSDRYFGKVFISDINAVFTKGWIAIFDKRTKKQLIKIQSDELAVDLHEGKLVSNVRDLPYGEQSLIIHEDFNFDGKKDLALMDGQNSCYHGPSFLIYLATSTGFVRSRPFTQLAQEYCGMFRVDHNNKRIYTMTKSSCCWHQYSDFVVRNNKPMAVKVVEEGVNTNGLTWDFIEETLIAGKMRRKDYSLFDADRQKQNTFYSFEFSNKKIMRLLNTGSMLYYVFTDKDNKVELVYDGRFQYSEAENALLFNRGRTKYKISYDGIFITTPNGNFDMKASVNTITGDFSQLQNNVFENVDRR